MKKYRSRTEHLPPLSLRKSSSTPLISHKTPHTSRKSNNIQAIKRSVSSVKLPEITTPKIQSLPTKLPHINQFTVRTSSLKQSTSNLPSPKFSYTQIGRVKSFAYSSDIGISRQSNEDRITIIPKIPQPPSFRGFQWPQSSYFAIFDGDGGSGCAQFMKNHLHKFIITDRNFPHKPREAIIHGFAQAEADFSKMAVQQNDFSGTCALVLIVVNERCYVGNLGDCRAVLSYREGQISLNLTVDHKPDAERERIKEAGGSIFQSRTGVWRIEPGKLAVSRSLGDIQAKLPEFGGLPGVLSAVPEVWSFLLTEQADFIVIGTDGVFDVLNNESLVGMVWMWLKKKEFSFKNCGEIVNRILDAAMRL